MRKANYKAVCFVVMLWCGIAAGQEDVRMHIYAEPDKENAGPYIDRSRKVPYDASVTINGDDWASFSFEVVFFERAAVRMHWVHPISVSCTVSCSVFASNEAFDCEGIKVPGSFLAKSSLPPACELSCKDQKIALEKACPALNKAAAVAFSYVEADSPYTREEFGKYKQDLLDELDNVKRALCGKNNQEALAELEKIRQSIERLDESTYLEDSGGTEGSHEKYMPLAEAERQLLALKDQIGCSGGCAKGTRRKTEKDDEAIEKAKGFTEKRIKQVKDEVLEESAKIEPGAKTDKLNRLNKKLNRLQKTIAAWDQVKAAQCVPPELMSATLSYIHAKQHSSGQTQDECNSLCYHLGKWVRDLTGEDIHQKTTTDECLAMCN